MKIIFLDIDGVLITVKSRTVPDSRCVKILNDITDNTGAKIVVTSHRGISGKGIIGEWLAEHGVTGEVFDVTEHGRSLCRGYLIAKWLRDIKDNTDINIDGFVIVDDDSDMAYLIHKLVRTNPVVGITKDDARNIIYMLEGSS